MSLMKLKIFLSQGLLALLLVLCIGPNLLAKTPQRRYELFFPENRELIFWSSGGQFLNMAFSDLYFEGMEPALPDSIDAWIEPPWYAFWTFTWTLYPHEYGHWSRAKQVGSDFHLVSYRFPLPYAVHNMPPGMTGQQEVLVSIGGFEVNSLTSQAIHKNLFKDGYAYSDQMVYNLFNQMLYPMYNYLFIPVDPNLPLTWTDAVGDPSQFTLLTFKNYYGRSAITGSGTVDPDLIALYREIGQASVLWPLLDPTMWLSFSAFTYDRKGGKDILYPWLIGNANNGWSYSTFFNPSPLGYELYLTNYIKINGQLFSFYKRRGAPFHNEGEGVEIPGLFSIGQSDVGASYHRWNQDLYGSGTAIGVDWDIYFGDWTLTARYEKKDSGYLLGRRLEASTLFYGGISAKF